MAGNRFQFRLASVLGVRRHERDLCRQALAVRLAEEQSILQRIGGAQSEREQTLSSFREELTQTRINSQLASWHRWHITQLDHQLLKLQNELEGVQIHVEEARMRLVDADQKVRVLEKLEEIQRAEFDAELEKTAAREREDAWSAGQATVSRTME